MLIERPDSYCQRRAGGCLLELPKYPATHFAKLPQKPPVVVLLLLTLDPQRPFLLLQLRFCTWEFTLQRRVCICELSTPIWGCLSASFSLCRVRKNRAIRVLIFSFIISFSGSIVCMSRRMITYIIELYKNRMWFSWKVGQYNLATVSWKSGII